MNCPDIALQLGGSKSIQNGPGGSQEYPKPCKTHKKTPEPNYKILLNLQKSPIGSLEALKIGVPIVRSLAHRLPRYLATTPKPPASTKWRKVEKSGEKWFPDPFSSFPKLSRSILQTGKFEKVPENLIAQISGYNSEASRQHKVEKS